MSYQNLDGNPAYDNATYGQYNPYGSNRTNPYVDNRNNPYGDPSNNPYSGNINSNNSHENQESYGYGAGYDQRDVEQGNGGYEMGNMKQGSSGGPGAILEKCRNLNEGITQVTEKRETELANAHKEFLDASSGKEDQYAHQKLEYIEDEINKTLRYLRDQLNQIKDTPGAGDSRVYAQVDNSRRNLKREIEQYQRSQNDFRKQLEDQLRRRYRIANKDATSEEVEEGVKNILLGNEQSFEIAGARSRQANDTRQAVRKRSKVIRAIEEQLIELSKLYNEVADMVLLQEPLVEQIDRNAEVTHQNVVQANTKLNSAITSARNARRWKWYALIIIIIIIAIVVGVAVGVTQANKSVNNSN